MYFLSKFHPCAAFRSTVALWVRVEGRSAFSNNLLSHRGLGCARPRSHSGLRPFILIFQSFCVPKQNWLSFRVKTYPVACTWVMSHFLRLDHLWMRKSGFTLWQTFTKASSDFIGLWVRAIVRIHKSTTVTWHVLVYHHEMNAIRYSADVKETCLD